VTEARAARLGSGRPEAVVFDLGGVLIDWNPRHLYRKLFDDPAAMETFLATVVTADWNEQQDAGRPWPEAIEWLVARHPDERARIEAYHDRWPEMLGGPIAGTVEILSDLRETGVRLLALSNWSGEMFERTRARFPFLDWFDGVVISGHVGLVKPDPRIFGYLVERFGVLPERSLFIDDQPGNADVAARLGFETLRFVDSETLRRDLEGLGLLPIRS